MSYPVEWEEMMEKEAKARWMKEFERTGTMAKANKGMLAKKQLSARREAKMDISEAARDASKGSAHGRSVSEASDRHSRLQTAKRPDFDPKYRSSETKDNPIKQRLAANRQAAHVADVKAGRKPMEWNKKSLGRNTINNQREELAGSRDSRRKGYHNSSDVFKKMNEVENSAKKLKKPEFEAKQREAQARLQHQQANRNEAYQRSLS